jgi:hypothetical protein
MAPDNVVRSMILIGFWYFDRREGSDAWNSRSHSLSDQCLLNVPWLNEMSEMAFEVVDPNHAGYNGRKHPLKIGSESNLPQCHETTSGHKTEPAIILAEFTQFFWQSLTTAHSKLLVDMKSSRGRAGALAHFAPTRIPLYFLMARKIWHTLVLAPEFMLVCHSSGVKMSRKLRMGMPNVPGAGEVRQRFPGPIHSSVSG